MRLFHIAIATFLLVWGPVLAADEDPIEIFEAATLSKISEEAYDELGADLLESGLSQYDVDRIISKFAADAARCITLTRITSPRRNSCNFLSPAHTRRPRMPVFHPGESPPNNALHLPPESYLSRLLHAVPQLLSQQPHQILGCKLA